MSLADFFCVIFCWSQEKSISCVSADFGLSKKVVIRIYDKIRKIISEYVSSEPIRLGGPGIICQIDESLFSHKVKAHRGRAPQQQIWVFGILDTSRSKGHVYLEVVENRSAETLLPIISKVVKPGTIVYSDEWAGYSKISSRLGLVHKTGNHSLHFVDPRKACILKI